MSARLYKIGVIVLLLHGILLTVIWVGFPVPLPRLSAAFVYVGSASLEDRAGALERDLNSSEVRFDHNDPSLGAPWAQLREVRKPKP